MTIGTCVKITTTLSTAPDSVAITIWDPDGTVEIDAAAMNPDDTTTYSYVFQSDEDGVPGFYTALLEATVGTYTAVSEHRFALDARQFDMPTPP